MRLERRTIVLQRYEHLADNFARGEVANQAERCRQAEMAIDCTSGLSRNANRLAVFLGHEHCFDRCRRQQAVICLRIIGRRILRRLERENVAYGAVIRAVLADDSRQFDGRFARKPFAKFGWKIRHACKIKTPLGVERMINLRAAVGRLAERFEERAQLFRGFPQQVAGTNERAFGSLRCHLVLMIARRGFVIFCLRPKAREI